MALLTKEKYRESIYTLQRNLIEKGQHLWYDIYSKKYMPEDNRFEDIYSPDMERRTMTMCEVLDRVENRWIQKGIQEGIIQGEDTILSLMNYLLSNNRTEDAKKATEDKAYRNKLLSEISEKKWQSEKGRG